MSSPFAQELAAKRSLSRRALPAGWPPRLSDAELVAALEPPAPGVRVRAVLDTDTFNEIDDQFAIVQLLLSPERVDLRAIYAAPFFNDRAVSSVDGMEKSYEEILRLLARMGVDPAGLVHRGSCQPLQSWASPEPSEAATDLVKQALATPEGELLYVIAIGAITNVASALLLDPRIARRVVVVWLGGHANGWAHTLEYNLQGDLLGAQLLLDSGVPLVRLPCAGVVTHLHSTIPEIDAFVKGQGAIGDFLAARFREYCPPGQEVGWSKEIWDMAAVAWVLNERWVPTVLEPSPLLTNDFTWSRDPSRHMSRTATAGLQRDGILRDFFSKLAAAAAAAAAAAKL